MPNDTSAQIEERWNEVRPRDWRQGQHSSERELLESILGADELMLALLSGSYTSARIPIKIGTHNGVVVATAQRVFFVDKSYRDIEGISSIPYDSLEGLNYSLGMMYGAIQFVDSSGVAWQVDNVIPKSLVRSFVESVCAFVDELSSSPSPSQPAQKLMVHNKLDKIQKQWIGLGSNIQTGQGAKTTPKASEAHMTRIDTEWEAAKPSGWGKGMHSGERKMLYTLLDTSEPIKAVVGGTYRAEQDTNRIHRHKGIAVATSRRVLFLDKGVLGSSEVSEMSYRSIEGITYSTGMIFGGVQIRGIGGAGWRIEDVDPKSSAQLFAESVRALVEEFHSDLSERQQTPPAAGQAPATPHNSVADELTKLAALVKDGFVSQEEFDAKKKEMLGL